MRTTMRVGGAASTIPDLMCIYIYVFTCMGRRHYYYNLSFGPKLPCRNRSIRVGCVRTPDHHTPKGFDRVRKTATGRHTSWRHSTKSKNKNEQTNGSRRIDDGDRTKERRKHAVIAYLDLALLKSIPLGVPFRAKYHFVHRDQMLWNNNNTGGNDGYTVKEKK